jgi:hypothetical protein
MFKARPNKRILHFFKICNRLIAALDMRRCNAKRFSNILHCQIFRWPYTASLELNNFSYVTSTNLILRSINLFLIALSFLVVVLNHLISSSPASRKHYICVIFQMLFEACFVPNGTVSRNSSPAAYFTIGMPKIGCLFIKSIPSQVDHLYCRISMRGNLLQSLNCIFVVEGSHVWLPLKAEYPCIGRNI